MLGRLNHIALAVPDISQAIDHYRKTMGATVSAPRALPDHGVTVAFVDVGNTKIELLAELGEASPIATFLERNPRGGMHHVCYEVPDIIAARDQMLLSGARILGDGRPTIGAHGKPVIFVHPSDMFGTLTELEEV